ncbi:MAG: efflux RND transporter periplasmic adaptor subunit [Algicola sp.]|nr:efflux RND transporter periplasmic adaptor subunit [Algicola sp.]
MSKSNFIQKALFPAAVTLVTVVSFFVISSTAQQAPPSDTIAVQTTNITVLPLLKGAHETRLKGFGEIVPAEITQLSTRVSGTVVFWSEQFVRGGIIKKGEILLRLEDSRYQAEYKNAEAERLSATAELESELGLAKIAKSELERINSKAKNKLFLREPQINSAYAAVQSAEAQLISAKNNLTSTVIHAPFDALVVERNIGLGQYVVEGNSIAVLYNVQSAEIDIPIAKFDSQFLPDTIAGHPARVTLPDNNLFSEAQLSRQLRLTDSQTRTNALVVVIKDIYLPKQGSVTLQFGDYVKVEFAGRVLQDVYLVPEDLVSQARIWVMNEEQQLERRDVSVVRNENGFAIIREGINRGDKLVTSVPEYPYTGMPVKVIAATSDTQGQG